MLQQYTSIVTAGSPVLPAYAEHPNYPTIQAAISAVPGGGLVLLMPGIHWGPSGDTQIYLGKDITIAGTGLTPEDTELRIASDKRHGYFYAVGRTILLENLHIHRPAGGSSPDVRSFYVQQGSGNANLKLRFHRVRFSSDQPNSYGMYYGGYRNLWDPEHYTEHVRFTHCQLDRPPGNGYQFRWTPLDKTRLEKCYCPGGLATFDTGGSWALNDSVTTPTEGYGPQYALPVTPLQRVPVQGTARHAGQARVRVVVFLWDTTWWHTTPPLAADGSWTAYIPPGHAYGVYYTGFDGGTTPRVEGPYPPVAA